MGTLHQLNYTCKLFNLFQDTPKDLKNVAKGKPAKQSSVVESYGAHLAVDGINSAGSCMATNFEKEPWWRVDLQEQHLIYRIKIFNKDPKVSQCAQNIQKSNSF